MDETIKISDRTDGTETPMGFVTIDSGTDDCCV